MKKRPCGLCGHPVDVIKDGWSQCECGLLYCDKCCHGVECGTCYSLCCPVLMQDEVCESCQFDAETEFA